MGSAVPSSGEFTQLGAHVVRRTRAIDDEEPFWIFASAFEVLRAHPAKEFLLLGLEAIGGARTGQPTRCDFWRHVEQQREIGPQVVVDPVFQSGDALDGESAPAGLVGVSRIGEAIAQDPLRRPPTTDE